MDCKEGLKCWELLRNGLADVWAEFDLLLVGRGDTRRALPVAQAPTLPGTCCAGGG